MKFFNFKKSNKDSISAEGVDLVAESRNWYADRYESVVVQRNILFLFVFLAMAIILGGVFVVGEIAISKTIEPFIVEVEEKSGIVNVVDPSTRVSLSEDEALNNHFVIQYIKARETYNLSDYQYNYYTLTRLFSDRKVYSNFSRLLDSDPKSPIKLFGSNVSTAIRIRSIQYIVGDTTTEADRAAKTVQIRFSVLIDGKDDSKLNKIATIRFKYMLQDLKQEERFINPLGFTIFEYRVDDETN